MIEIKLQKSPPNGKIYAMELIDKVKKAIAFSKNNEFKKAEEIYLEILKDNPENNTVLSFLGMLYFENEKYVKANKYLLKSYKIKEDKNLLPYLLKINYHFTNYMKVIEISECISQDKMTLAMYYMLLFACNRVQDYKKEAYFAERAHKTFPFSKIIIFHLSRANINCGNFEKGEKYCSELLKLYPKYSKTWECLGLIKELLYGAEDEACECYKKMVRLGDKIDGYLNLIINYSKNLSPKTLYYRKKVLELSPKAQINFVTASYYLSNKNFKKGFFFYLNKDICNKSDLAWRKKFKRPWLGGSFKNETLFIFGDQGLGDQIQHARYIPFLVNKFKEIKIMFSEPLLPIMHRYLDRFPNIKIYKRCSNFPRYDKSVELAHVLYYLKMNFNHIPNSEGYLICDNNKVKQFAKEYFNTNKFKLGICWEAGGNGIRDQIHRNINIHLFKDILKLKNMEFYSFQKDPIINDYKEYKNIVDLKDSLTDYDDTAAALKNIDLLITVDTSLAHMAGALGVKTFLLLPYCSDWRWFKNTKTTEWYDSIRIFKQKSGLGWTEVFENILIELKNISK